MKNINLIKILARDATVYLNIFHELDRIVKQPWPYRPIFIVGSYI